VEVVGAELAAVVAGADRDHAGRAAERADGRTPIAVASATSASVSPSITISSTASTSGGSAVRGLRDRKVGQ
jgi:hypothetical protein